MARRRQTQQGLLWLGLLMPLILYGASVLGRPSRESIAPQPLFQGIVYRRQIKNRPRPQIIHIVDIDLRAPGLTPFVTPGYDGTAFDPIELKIWETVAQRTSEFIDAEGVQLAINANFFYPFREVALWNYRPRSGQPGNLVGLAISNGETLSIGDSNWSSLCFIKQQAMINSDGTCPQDTQQAVAGRIVLLENAQPTETVQQQIIDEKSKPYPFTVAALNADGTRLWLVLVDGKQPLYSEGLTLEEVTTLVQDLGADTALQLDGGGSTTLAIAASPKPQVLNVPIHAKIPGQERPVANNLGFFAQPLAP